MVVFTLAGGATGEEPATYLVKGHMIGLLQDSTKTTAKAKTKKLTMTTKTLPPPTTMMMMIMITHPWLEMTW